MNHKIENIPLVSVIIPSYNHENYIEQAILSIVNQTYGNIELIVVDDGSSDGSVQLLRGLSDKYGFRLFEQENAGVSAALNKGIELSKGEFISVCASDDYYHVEKTKKQVDYLLRNKKFGIVYSDRIKFYENGIFRNLPSNKNGEGDLFDGLLLQKIRVPPCSILYRRAVFDTVGKFDTSLAVEDFDMILRVANCFKIGYLKEPLLYYRTHVGNTVNQVGKMKVNCEMIIDKWAEKSCYSEAKVRNKLSFFRACASSERLKALKMLPVSYLILKEYMFYEGLVRMVIPKFVYKRLMRL